MSRARFISFEGSEGCGKSTQIARLKDRLEARGEKVVLTREPGGTALGETIRHLLKHAPEGRGMAAETELLLFAASRAELTRSVILPSLAAGYWILCDRFADSTTVYQGVARRLAAEEVVSINRFAMGTARPGLTLILDVSVEEAARRLALRPRVKAELIDRMEEESADFFARVKAGYQALAQAEPARVKWIDGTGETAAVAERIWTEVARAFYF